MAADQPKPDWGIPSWRRIVTGVLVILGCILGSMATIYISAFIGLWGLAALLAVVVAVAVFVRKRMQKS